MIVIIYWWSLMLKKSYTNKGPSNRVWIFFLPPRVSGTLKAGEYAGKNRISESFLFY